MLPLVQEPLLDNHIKWSEALESWEPFRTRFVGRPTALFAGSILVALNAWATGVDAPLMDKRPTSHPFCIIVCGAHGTGKSAVLSFLLQEALAWGGWSEDDFCYTPDARALQWLQSLGSRKATYVDELHINVLEDAETTAQSFQGQPGPFIDVVRQCGNFITFGAALPNRTIIVTSYLTVWMRALAQLAKVPVINVNPLPETTVSVQPWVSWLGAAEGIPSRAMALYYVHQLGRSDPELLAKQEGKTGRDDPIGVDSVHVSLGSVSSLVLVGARAGGLGASWWDACQTLLSSYQTALYQLQNQGLMMACGADEMDKCLRDRQLLGLLRRRQVGTDAFALYAFLLRHQVRRHSQAQSKRDPYAKEASFEQMNKIKTAQRARFQATNGHMTGLKHAPTAQAKLA